MVRTPARKDIVDKRILNEILNFELILNFIMGADFQLTGLRD
jgi:hypothetical protein